MKKNNNEIKFTGDLASKETSQSESVTGALASDTQTDCVIQDTEHLSVTG